MTTKYAFAFHEIVRKGSDGNTETIPASSKGVNSVFQTTDEELKVLIGLNAAREATEEEAIVFKSRNPSAAKAVSAPAPAQTPVDRGRKGSKDVDSAEDI